MNATLFHEGRRLEEPELLPAGERCPICLAAGPRAAVHRIQASPDVDLLACPRCGGASASRMPRPEVLDAYYAGYYGDREMRVTCPDPERFAAPIVRRLPPPPGRGTLRVLDFGGGDGSLGAAVGRALARRGGAAGVEVALVDFQAPAEVPGVRIAGHRALDEVRGRFDVVLASAVLEHVPDLHDTAARLFALAAPGGILYARTPYLAPLLRIAPGIDLTYPAHVHDLGSEFWGRVVDTFGLDAELVRSGPSPVEADPRRTPLRAAATWMLKLPARLEAAALGPARPRRFWAWTGGWEAVLRFRGQAAARARA